MLKEKLARKRERLARGEPVDEEEEAQLEAELEGLQQEDNARMDARTLLENMQKRYVGNLNYFVGIIVIYCGLPEATQKLSSRRSKFDKKDI